MRRHMNGTEDGNSYKALKKREKVTCDFCERTFKNRFESVIHTASHIIIPLMKQSCLFCDSCNSFITQDDLNTHNLIKHPEEFIKKEEPSYEANPEIDNPSELSYSEEINDVTIPIRERLKFEDDGTSFNGILMDLVTECKVNVPICDQWDDGETKCYEPSGAFNKVIPKQEVHIKIEKKQRLIDSLVLEDPLPKAIECLGMYKSEQNESNSYLALVRPGIFSCRYCLASFPNRFSLIQHEVVHIEISKGRPLLCLYCDRYIAGNHYTLNKHINKYHFEKEGIKYISTKTENCKKCGLKYRKYRRHLRNYHPESAPQKVVIKNMKVLKCCDLCMLFFQNKINLKYILKGSTKDELGVRYPCDICGKLYFKLKIVQRHCNNRDNFDRVLKRKTNEDRLKLIQKRFKKLNLLNK